MTVSPRNEPPIAAERFVGRRAELATIAAALAAAGEGRASVVLLSGEPGVGKSRLIAEACLAAEQIPVRWLSGYAMESGGMPPYFPLARALGASVRTLFAEGHSGLGGVLPVLADAGIIPMAGFEPPVRLSSLSPEADRLRLLDAITTACTEFAHPLTLVLALDDLQWADAAFWEVMVYLARAAGGARILLVLAVREEALYSGGAVARAVAELGRQRLLHHIRLPRLTDDEVAVLASGVAGGVVSPELAVSIAGRSQGNPFFAEELVRDLVQRGQLTLGAAGWEQASSSSRGEHAALPLTLRLAIEQRNERLPAQTRTVLFAASVLGRTFAERVLASMLGQSREQIERALEPARVSGIVCRDPAGWASRLHAEETVAPSSDSVAGWSFVHDTVREAVYEQAGSDRRGLHASAAVAIGGDARPDEDFALMATLAYHWRLADEPSRGADAALAAATAASAVHAPAEALGYARSGRELRERAEASSSPSPLLAAARLAHGAAALAAGEYAEAETALRSALHEAQAAGDRALEAESWIQLGTLYRRRESPDEAAGCLYAALALLDDGATDHVELVHVLVQLAELEGITRARYDEATALGERALAMAGRLNQPAREAIAAAALADIRTRAGTAAAGRPLLRRALERAVAGDDPAFAAEICARLANAVYWTGEIGASWSYGERRLALAQKAGDPFGLRHAHSWLANLAWTRGDWQQSRRLLQEAAPVLARLDNPEPIAFLHLIDGMIDYRTGELERSHRLIAAAIDLFEQVDPATVVWYAGWLPLVCLALGRRDQAEQQIAAQERRIRALPRAALPARSALTLLALAYADLGDHDRGLACERALRPYAGDFHWSPARRSLAALAVLRGDEQQALTDLSIAEAHARSEGLRPDLALILHARSTLSLRHERLRAGDRDESRRLFESLGMTPRAEPGSAPDRPSVQPSGLTTREVEVLRLVSQGKTNREIAAALVISERTAINHLSHIFAKIGVENRAGATAFALRHGLE